MEQVSFMGKKRREEKYYKEFVIIIPLSRLSTFDVQSVDFLWKAEAIPIKNAFFPVDEHIMCVGALWKTRGEPCSDGSMKPFIFFWLSEAIFLKHMCKTPCRLWGRKEEISTVGVDTFCAQECARRSVICPFGTDFLWWDRVQRRGFPVCPACRSSVG